MTELEKAKLAEVRKWQRQHLPEAPMPRLIKAAAQWLANGRKGAFPHPVPEVG